MEKNSRIPGFSRLSIHERRRITADFLGIAMREVEEAFDEAGLSIEKADKLIENVIGTFALPFAIAPNFIVNGRELLIPMVVEEPSVVAAAANAARMVRSGGGFFVECSPPLMAAQIQVFTREPEKAKARIMEAREKVLEEAARTNPVLLALGGGPKDIEVRTIFNEETGSFLVVHLLVDVRDAMGANTVNSMAETVAPLLADLAEGYFGLRILTNLADRRLVRARAEVPQEALSPPAGWTEEEVLDAIIAASLFAECDPYRAATHNKGILNGTDAVVLATGNDWRAVEAGAHAYAARSGQYRPLCVWRKKGKVLTGYLEMPLALGIVGGPARLHAGVRLALRVLGAKSATDVAEAAAAAGMACNLAALRALATEGIQKGHMRLARRANEAL